MSWLEQHFPQVHALLVWLSALTLGDIWTSIYNPPTPLTLAIAAVVLAFRAPHYLKRWSDWKASRRVVDFEWRVPKEADPTWTGKVIEKPHLFSHQDDSSLLPPETGRTGTEQRDHITCFDPATGYHLTTLPLLSASEVAEQIQRAHNAQPAWARSTWPQRKMLLRSLKAWVMQDMDGIVRVACRDTGKLGVDAVFGEILTTLSKIDWLVKYGEKTLSPQKRSGNLLLSHKISYVHYTPLGTCLALVSWNYSFHNLISPILAALTAGNSIVVKCSEQVAWSSMAYITGIRACLRACGFDEELVQLVVCLPNVAETVTRNPLVKHITFIGSEPVGRKVAAAAADIMVPTCIELGGKDPAFLLPSCNVEGFVSHFLRGAFQSAGQNCIGIELFLVPSSLYRPFLAQLAPRVRALRPGTDVGALISASPHIPRLESLISQATSAGAKLLAGGRPYAHPTHPQGAYFEPTLLADVDMSMEIAKTEVFGPVMCVVKYENVDEAVRWLNESRFGLGAGVYGEDWPMCHDVAARLECGMVSMNDFGVFYLNQALPFGGVKASGHGRFGGEEGLRSLCSTKSVVRDRVFHFVRTVIPGLVDYPLPEPRKSWKFLHGLVGVGFGGVGEKLRGLVELATAGWA